MSPQVNAVVYCVDEKSQIQALERAQPVLSMDLGQQAGMDPDLSVRSGRVSRALGVTRQDSSA